MNLINELPELIEAEIISKETADKILNHYKNKQKNAPNRIFIIIGILGAILIGLGIVLILAHNWDEFPRAIKTIWAILPLLVGQGACIYSLIKKQNNTGWKEASATFLFFAVGASISLISQIYHIPGNIGSFLLTWMLLCAPLIFLLKSSTVSLLYLVGITYYAIVNGFSNYETDYNAHVYWLLLIVTLTHYFLLFKQNKHGIAIGFHQLFIPLSLLIVLGIVADESQELLFIAYMSLLGLFYSFGDWLYLKSQKQKFNAYLVVASLGTIIFLLILSFDFVWESLRTNNFDFYKNVFSVEFLAASIISLIAGGLLYLNKKNYPDERIDPFAYIFILFIAIFLIGLVSPLATILINLLVLAIGLRTIQNGVNQNHLGILNFGLTIISILIICRFFDTNLSYVIRGILFVLVGIAFFVSNYWMIKKRKSNG